MNSIEAENKLLGTTAWQIQKPSVDHAIEGFASLTSVLPKESIHFYVNCKSAGFFMEIFRMGWYNGDGGRLVMEIPSMPSLAQPIHETDELRKVECFWKVNYTLVVPENWCSGVYLCKMISEPDGYESYILFAVKQALHLKSDYLFQLSTNTYQAYNYWGRYSLYGDNESNLDDSHVLRAKSVSFNRPYLEGNGAGQFFNWEYQLLRWMEKNGLSIAYGSNQDLHEGKEYLSRAKAFLSTGHDEYWSKEMFDHLEDAISTLPLGAAFFCADSIYWQVRFEDSFNGKHRNMVCYKCDEHTPYTEDPIFKKDHKLVTAKFRDRHVNRAEQKLVGQMYTGWFSNVEPNQDLIITNTAHPIFRNTGIENGDRFPKLVGYEFDRVWRNFPKPEHLVKLAESPVNWNRPNDKGHGVSNTTIYTRNNGNSVFASGTMSWNWSLDDYGHTNHSLVSEKLQKLSLNLLQFISRTGIFEGMEYPDRLEPDNLQITEMNYAKKNSFKVLRYSWWIFGFIGFLLKENLSSVPDNTFLTIFIGIIDGVFVGWIFGFMMDNLILKKK